MIHGPYRFGRSADPVVRGMKGTMEGWGAREEALARRLGELIAKYGPKRYSLRGLDVGTQHATLPSKIAATLGTIAFEGVEPELDADQIVLNGIPVRRARCDSLPFESGCFQVVMLASVFEHLQPANRRRSLEEIHRVLSDDGILVGQIPNMNFPIELHSRLPLPQFLPRSVAERYVRRFSPTPWRARGVDWFKVGTRTLRAEAKTVGFHERAIDPFNPPREAIPESFRTFYGLLEFFPLGYTFVFAA